MLERQLEEISKPEKLTNDKSGDEWRAMLGHVCVETAGWAAEWTLTHHEGYSYLHSVTYSSSGHDVDVRSMLIQ